MAVGQSFGLKTLAFPDSGRRLASTATVSSRLAMGTRPQRAGAPAGAELEIASRTQRRPFDRYAKILSFPFPGFGPMKGELNHRAHNQIRRRQVGEEQVG
jgi:hypothetical protein